MGTKDRQGSTFATSAPNGVVSDDGELVITMATDDETVARTVYRVPIPAGLVSCTIRGKKYAVLDLSPYGVGLDMPDPQEFHVGTQIHGVHVCFAERVFEVHVEVVHISPHNGDGIICGLRVLSAADTEYAACMERILLEIKSRLFTTTLASTA
ncbi:hypothetical protein MASR1M90_12390 [Desulfovibrionales bacterium]